MSEDKKTFSKKPLANPSLVWYNRRMKNKYEVRIPKVQYSYYFIEAESEEQAIHLARFANRDMEDFQEAGRVIEEEIEVIQLKGDN